MFLVIENGSINSNRHCRVVVICLIGSIISYNNNNINKIGINSIIISIIRIVAVVQLVDGCC